MFNSFAFNAMLMSVGACSYGFVPAIVQFAYRNGFDTNAITNLQYIFAFAIIFVLFLVRFKTERFPRGKDLLITSFIGVTGGIAGICYFKSLSMLPASISIILMFQFAWMVMLIDITVKRKLPPGIRWVGMAIILVGTYLAVNPGTSTAASYPRIAIILGLCTALLYALMLFLPEYLSPQSTPIARTTVMLGTSMITVLIALPPSFPHTMGIMTLIGWGSLISLVGQVIPVLFIMKAVPIIGGRLAGVLGVIELPVTVISAALILGDQIGLLRWCGSGMIIAGILVSEMKINRKQSKTPTT